MKIVITISLLFHLQIVVSQQIAFHHLSVENGLPNNSVLSITQDKAGFIWLGTTLGLNRFDGQRIKSYKYDPRNAEGLSDNRITNLFTDSKGVVWIGTSNGVNLYSRERDVFRRVALGSSRPLYIYSFFEDAEGNIWIGSSEGVYILQPGQPRKYLLLNADKGLAGNIVRAVKQASDGSIWLGTNVGLSRLNKRNGSYLIKNFKIGTGIIDGRQHENYITALEFDTAGYLWIGTQNSGVYKFDTRAQTFNHYKSDGHPRQRILNNNIRCLLREKNGLIWIGTQEGITRLDPANMSFENYTHSDSQNESLSQNSVYSLFQDANGSVWIGTYFGGANISYAYDTPFSVIRNNDQPNSISNNVISSIVEDSQKNLWIGTEGGGLNYYDRATGKFSVYKHRSGVAGSLGSNLVKLVYLDKDNNVWVGTHGGGLNVLSPGSSHFSRYLFKPGNPESLNREVSCIYEDSYGRFWVGTDRNMKLFKRTGATLTEWPINHNVLPKTIVPRQFYEDSSKNLWIAAVQGLYLLNGNTLTLLDSASAANCIAQDPEGNIWAGLSSGGISMFRKGQKQNIKQDGFLRSLTVFGILVDADSTLWLSTDKGLLHFWPRNGFYRVYTKYDGVAEDQFNYNSYLKDKSGNFYFGGFNGITYFDPQKIQVNSYVAPLMFTNLKINNKEVGIGQPDRLLSKNINLQPALSFAHKQNIFTIEFALLNYIKTVKNRYQYQLQGFNEDWIETVVPAVTFTNLPAGRYRLVVKAANNDGVWSKPATLDITVKPPVWLTWQAYLLYILAAGAVLFFIVRFFFLRTLIKKENELHQVKLNFFTNVSHEIRTHLTLIMAPMERMLTEYDSNRFLNARLQEMQTHTNRLLKLVSELMDFRKAETDHLYLEPRRENIIPFLQKIYQSFRDISLLKNINMSFVHDKDDIMVNFDEEQLEKVFFNLIANAIKFTPDGGRIILHAQQLDDNAVITVTDNGHGIAPEYLDKLFTNFFQVADHGVQNTGYGIGLALSKNIVMLHKGSITVESQPAMKEREGKTTFTVVLPLNADISIKAGPRHPGPATDQGMLLSNNFETTPREDTAHDAYNHSYTVLIAEDNVDVNALIKNSFRTSYNVLCAKNGQVAWEMATAQIPDLIISDVMMPEMDGYTLCSKIKDDVRTSHIPVILLTAKSSQAENISGLQCGADIYLTKPFSTKVLLLNAHNLLLSRKILREKIQQDLNVLSFKTAEKTSSIKIANSKIDEAFLNKVIYIIEEHLDDPEFGVDMLSRKAAMSTSVFYKKIKALTGITVNDFIKQVRLKKAAELLAENNMTVYEVAYAVGYTDRKYFSREFKKYFGTLPSEYAEKQEGERK
ncbi:MAG: two-component regulator propeller domain-containing protein [Niabella sp.]